MQPKAHIATLPVNQIGRDFVVGDLHGCFHLLDLELQRRSFDPLIDRLFSVGDLVNRGPHSDRALFYLQQPWFHAVLGNHEDMILSGNLAKWWLDLDAGTQESLHNHLARLPIAIDVGQGQFGIVHADCPCDGTWQDFLSAIHMGDPQARRIAQWGRNRIQQSINTPLNGVNTVYIGHTYVEMPTCFGNVMAIDTGAVYGFLGTIPAGYLSVVQV